MLVSANTANVCRTCVQIYLMCAAHACVQMQVVCALSHEKK